MKSQVDVNFEVRHIQFPMFSKGLVIGVKYEQDFENETEWLVRWYGDGQGTTWHASRFLEAVNKEDGAVSMMDANSCPVCNRSPHLFGYPPIKKFRVACCKCGITGPYGLSEQEAIKRWNLIYINIIPC